jgi:hypothetical protein
MGGKGVGVAKGSLLCIAVSSGDRVSGYAGDGRLAVGDYNAILDVKALDLCHRGSSPNELSDDCKDRVGVDGSTWTIKGSVTLAIRVEVASIWIGGSSISGRRVSSTTGVSSASGSCHSVGRVRGESRGDGVSLPDIHLSAAGPVVADTCVSTVR